VALSIDQQTVTTDLGLDAKVTVTATGSMGFSGPVTIAAQLVDSVGNPITGVTPVLSSSTITLTTDGTGTADITVNAPGDIADLGATLKITGTSSANEADTQSAFTFNPVLHITWTLNAGQGVYDQTHLGANPYQLKAGRSIAVYNGSTSGLTVHTDGDIDGFPHENGATAPNQAYTKVLTTAGQSGQFYWHNNDNINDAQQHPHVNVVP